MLVKNYRDCPFMAAMSPSGGRVGMGRGGGRRGGGGEDNRYGQGNGLLIPHLIQGIICTRVAAKNTFFVKIFKTISIFAKICRHYEMSLIFKL